MSKAQGIELRKKADGFMADVVKRQESFGRLLPKGMDPAWFTAEVRVAVVRAPRLLECNPVSVFDAITTCAQLGLSPSGRLGSAYLIPYGQKCTLVVGYRGMVDLAYRSGEIVSVGAQVVHENDDFTAQEGFDLQVQHKRTEDDPGPLRAVYAWANTRAGGAIKVLMYRREVDPIKRASLSKKRQGAPPTPWETNEEEMWKKTALRRLFKVCPLSPQKAQGLTKALEVEDAEWEEMALDVEVDDAPATSTERLKRTLKERSEAVTPAWEDAKAMGAMAEKTGTLPLSHPDARPPEPGTGN